MTAYLTDEEQVERLKQWVKEYGSVVIISIAIAMLASFGWRYWLGHQNLVRNQASTNYEQLILNAMNNDNKQIQLQAKYLIKQYPKTSYAEYAAFLLARSAIENKNYADAVNQLQWIIDSTKTDPVKGIAQIRLSRVLIAQNKLPEALKILDAINDKAFAPAVLSVKGDIYLAMNNRPAARNAYQEALARTPQPNSTRALLEMKLADVTQVSLATKPTNNS